MSLAAAPRTGSYLKQPTRSSEASSQPLQQHFEIRFGLAGKADDEGRAQRQIGADLAPARDALQRFFLRRRPLHALQHLGRGVLKRDVEIGQDLSVGHQRDDLVDVRIGIDVVQPHPDAEFAERAREVDEFRAYVSVAPLARRVFNVEAVGGGVLRDDQQFLHAGLHQFLGFAQHVGGRARHEIAAQRRNDAERAAIIAALGNLQIGVVPRRELDAFRRHQIEERIVLRRQCAMHRIDHAFVLLRAGDREHVRDKLTRCFPARRPCSR